MKLVKCSSARIIQIRINHELDYRIKKKIAQRGVTVQHPQEENRKTWTQLGNKMSTKPSTHTYTHTYINRLSN